MVDFNKNQILWNRLYQLTTLQHTPKETINNRQEIKVLFDLLVPECKKQQERYGKT